MGVLDNREIPLLLMSFYLIRYVETRFCVVFDLRQFIADQCG